MLRVRAVMTDYTQIPAGELVRDGLGHWYHIVDGGPYQYRVQPLTAEHRPLGVPIRVFRSEIRREGE